MKAPFTSSVPPWACPKCHRQNAYFVFQCKCGFELKAADTLNATGQSKSRSQLIEEHLEKNQPVEVQQHYFLLRRFRKMLNIFEPENYPNLRRVNGCGTKLREYVPAQQYTVMGTFDGLPIETRFRASVMQAWWCFLFVPIIPGDFFVVDEEKDAKFYFYGQLSKSDAVRLRNIYFGDSVNNNGPTKREERLLSKGNGISNTREEQSALSKYSELRKSVGLTPVNENDPCEDIAFLVAFELNSEGVKHECNSHPEDDRALFMMIYANYIKWVLNQCIESKFPPGWWSRLLPFIDREISRYSWCKMDVMSKLWVSLMQHPPSEKRGKYTGTSVGPWPDVLIAASHAGYNLNHSLNMEFTFTVADGTAYIVDGLKRIYKNFPDKAR